MKTSKKTLDTKRTLVVGDIHGRIEALREVLTKSNFNYEEDQLIILGDIVDGGYNTYEVIEELLKIKNTIYIIGNHDEWFMNHIRSGWSEDIWLSQGGRNTIKSYEATGGMIPVTHQDFLNNGVYYYLNKDKDLFVHGGIDPRLPLNKQSREVLLWDRSLIEECHNGLIIKDYNRVFVGHTTTQTYDSYEPIRFGKLFMLDTGAGWSGRLTIMDIDSYDYWQSTLQEPARGNE